jgi:hypothetical protein
MTLMLVLSSLFVFSLTHGKRRLNLVESNALQKTVTYFSWKSSLARAPVHKYAILASVFHIYLTIFRAL